MADMLQHVEREAKLSMITVVDLEGRVWFGRNDPDAYGDDTLMRDYDDSPKPGVVGPPAGVECSHRQDDPIVRDLRSRNPRQRTIWPSRRGFNSRAWIPPRARGHV